MTTIIVNLKNPKEIHRVKRAIDKINNSPNIFLKDISNSTKQALIKSAVNMKLIDEGYLIKHIQSIRKNKNKYFIRMPKYGDWVSDFGGKKTRIVPIIPGTHIEKWARRHRIPKKVQLLRTREHPFIQETMNSKQYTELIKKVINIKIKDIIKRYK